MGKGVCVGVCVGKYAYDVATRIRVAHVCVSLCMRRAGEGRVWVPCAACTCVEGTCMCAGPGPFEEV